MRHAYLVFVAALALSPLPAASQNVALDLTRAQLDDADLVDAKGKEIGEVERVLIAADGAVAGLVVEIDQRDPAPDKLVRVPLAGLKAVADKDDAGEFNIQTQQTVAELMALPAWTASK